MTGSPNRHVRVGLAIVVPAVVAIGLVLALGRPNSPTGGSRGVAAASASSSSSFSIDARSLPTPVRPAFTPKLTPLPRATQLSRWAPILHDTEVRSRPTIRAAVIGRLATLTPDKTANIVLVLGRRVDVQGQLWVRVRFPALPTNAAGWVSRESLGGYGTVQTHLVVDLERLTATLYRTGRIVFRVRVGVGAPAWPTPRGEFYIRERLTSLDPQTYGPLAFGTSARSAILTDWPGGGFVGIHGTSQPNLIPGRVSHGCIRLRNPDIVRLGRLMPVGTPLTIR